MPSAKKQTKSDAAPAEGGGILGGRLARILGRRIAQKPSTPEGLRVYAVGDVHGCFDLLTKMQELIAADLAKDTPNRSVELYVGDYVDRGPQSREVLDYLSGEQMVCDRRVCLRGNHEEMLLAALEELSLMAEWFDYGGRETLVSYGIVPPALAAPSGPLSAQNAFRSAFPEQHRRFVEAMPYLVEIGGYAFVHAGIDPAVSLAQQRREDLVWMREPFLSSDVSLERFVVHGHTPTDEPDMRGNRVNIDTGAFLTGRLTCLVLEGEERRFLQATTRGG